MIDKSLIEVQNGNFAKPVLGVVLSLFDGMSCGQIALNRAGISYDKYYASEIDTHAIKVTQHNYPDTIQLGDVTKVKIKLLCLSDVYSYICNYDSNLQSNISEWEVLYWLNKDFTLSAKIRTQKPNERQEVSETSTVQRIEEVWFSKREMGSVRKFGDYTTSRRDGEENDIRVPKQLQYGKWGYDNDIYRRYKKENIGIASGETKNGDSEKKNFRNIEEAIFKGRESEGCFRENKKSNVEEGCSGKLFERKKEDRLSREVEKEKGNRRTKEGNFINEVIRELCRWNETDGIAQDYWNILRLHKAEQITVVEHEAGFYLFKGRIDLCIGGSPCQGFSFSGKQLNFEDPRSKLFFEFVRLIKECKPKYWLLENVAMKKEYQDVISEHLGVHPILINSSLVSAQNRKRLYWTNIGKISQPKDKGITWGDVREHNIEWGAMYYTDKAMDWIGKHGTRKGKPLKIHADNEKMQMLEASHHKKYSSQRFFGIIDQPAQITGRRLNEFGKREDYNKNIKTTQCLEVRGGDKVNCLTTVQKDNVISVLPIGRYPDVFKELEEGKHYRYITPIECERLQTVPDNYTDCVSNSQRYRMLGNGWTVDVISHIFSYIEQKCSYENAS